MLIDMHTHSEYSHDSSLPVYESALAAIENGIEIFAVTDHADIQFYNERNIFENIQKSNEEAAKLNFQFKDKVQILRGVELGEGTWSYYYSDKILNSNEYDVVLLSVHDLRTSKIHVPFSRFDFTTLTKDELFDFINKYFDSLLLTLKTIKGDICAHLTLPFRYINNKCGLNVSTELFDVRIEEILKYLIDNKIALEVNCSASNGGIIPEERIIRKYKAMGGYLITLGSDAHVSKNIGNGIKDTIPLLKNIGFENYYYYKDRKAVAVSL